MELTKPAGVFLQLLSIPLMLGGCVYGLGNHSTGGWVSLGVGIILLYLGGQPARKKKD